MPPSSPRRRPRRRTSEDGEETAVPHTAARLGFTLFVHVWHITARRFSLSFFALHSCICTAVIAQRPSSSGSPYKTMYR